MTAEYLGCIKRPWEGRGIFRVLCVARNVTVTSQVETSRDEFRLETDQLGSLAGCTGHQNELSMLSARGAHVHTACGDGHCQ